MYIAALNRHVLPNRTKGMNMDNHGQVLRMHQSYMEKAFGNIDLIRDNMVISTEDLQYDTLVGTGLSGALVVPTLARLMGLHWAIVRKSDGTHSTNIIEGEIGQRWLFVDDLISSGVTLKRVVNTVKEVVARSWFETIFVGIYQYQYNSTRTADNLYKNYLL